MENLVDKALKEMISNALLELEDIANSDVLCYSGKDMINKYGLNIFIQTRKYL